MITKTTNSHLIINAGFQEFPEVACIFSSSSKMFGSVESGGLLDREV
jgi:hypothetical protein